MNSLEPRHQRPGWDAYFLDIARQVARRSSCLRRQVGALIVRDKRIVATGYNGAPPGVQSSYEIGSCLRDERNIASGTCHEICRGLHAEQNALLQAARFGTPVEGSVLYCTHQPCVICSKMIIGAGIRCIMYLEPYPDELGAQLLRAAGVESQHHRSGE